MGGFRLAFRWVVSIAEYASTTAQDTLSVILIETAGAFEHIKQVCKVGDMDCMIVASFDLSTKLVVSSQLGYPKLLNAVARIKASAFKAGIQLVIVGFSKEPTEAAIDKGYRIIAGFDAIWLKNATQKSVECTEGVP